MLGLRAVLAGLAVFVLVAGCTGGEDGGGGEKIDHLVVAPDGATIDASTTLTLRATGVTASGRHVPVPVEDVSWTPTSGSVDASGVFTPAAAGDVTVTAEAGGNEGVATIHVIAAGTLDVTVVDSVTGAPLTGAVVALVDSASTMGITAADGTTQLTGSFSGALDVSIEASNHWPFTIYGLRTKDVRVPVRPVNPPASGSFEGIIDFTEAYDADAPASGHLWVGIGGPAIKGNVLAYGLDSLLGPDRTIEIIGSEIDAPSNLYVHGLTPPYIATSPPGETVAFGLGGEVAISDITDIIGGGGSDLGEVITELLPIFNTFHYTAREGVQVASNQTLSGQDLVLSTPLSTRARLTVPARPVPDPNPLVVAAVDFGPAIGFVPAGLNVVDGETETRSDVRVPPLSGTFEDHSYVFLVVSQEGGLSAGGGDQQVAVLTRGHTKVGDVELPEFLAPPAHASFGGDGASRSFEYDPTADADFLFHTFTMTVNTSSTGTYEWDVVAAGDSSGFVLPMVSGTHGAQSGGSWTVQSLGLESQTYESLFTPGAPIDSTSYFNDANRVVITNADVN